MGLVILGDIVPVRSAFHGNAAGRTPWVARIRTFGQPGTPIVVMTIFYLVRAEADSHIAAAVHINVSEINVVNIACVAKNVSGIQPYDKSFQIRSGTQESVIVGSLDVKSDHVWRTRQSERVLSIQIAAVVGALTPEVKTTVSPLHDESRAVWIASLSGLSSKGFAPKSSTWMVCAPEEGRPITRTELNGLCAIAVIRDSKVRAVIAVGEFASHRLNVAVLKVFRVGFDDRAAASELSGTVHHIANKNVSVP